MTTKTETLDRLKCQLAELLDECEDHWKPFIAAHKKAKDVRKEIQTLKTTP